MSENPWKEEMSERYVIGPEEEALVLECPLSIGTLQWGTTWLDQHFVNPKGCISEQTARDIMCELRRKHVTLFDTAEGYGGGTSEKRLARAAAASCDAGQPPVYMTKFLPTSWRYSHACFERALRGSLKRLGIECCPIYLLHTPVHWRSIEYWVQSAAICKRKGLLKAFGLSNCDADLVRRAYVAGVKYGVPVVCNQVMYNLLDYNSPKLRAMEQACKDTGMTIVAYSPIGQGLLTDALTPEALAKNRPAKMTCMTWEKLQPLRTELKRIADAHGKTMAQVAINWCVCKETIPLVGCRSVQQARDSLGSLPWRLNKQEVEALDQVALSRSTLESPPWRRAIFVFLAGVLMLLCRALDWLGVGPGRS